MKKDIHYIYLGLLLVFVLLLPYLINWDNNLITIHDYLDGIFIYPEIIRQNNAIWEFNSVMPFMNGINRDAFPMTFPWEFKPLINYFFPGYAGVYLNLLVVKLVAFLGMWLLLNKFICKNRWITFIISVIYAMIPFYVDFGLSSAGIPLLCFAILNLKNRTRIFINLLIIVLFGLFSSFPLSGFFVCIILFLYIIAIWYEEKQFNIYLILSLLLLSGIYILCNWPMMADFFWGAEFIPHRKEWIIDASFMDLIIEYVKDTFIMSQYHAGEFFVAPIIAIFCYVYYKYRKIDKTISSIMGLFVIIACFILIGKFSVLLPFEVFTSFQFDRFYFFYPALCFIMVGKSIDIVYTKKRNMALMLVIVLFICVFIRNKEYIVNCAKLVGVELSKEPSFKTYYDTSLFAQIHKDLNISNDYSTKVVSLGMVPAIASYNGFWSLDGYISSYSLDYKHKFRKVIEKELNKSKIIHTYFDNWGSRCYLFSSELGKKFIFGKKEEKSTSKLEINSNALKELGCQYILSAVEIRNYKELGLSYVNSYTTPDSYWNIRVYKLI